jgi:hypothetical protein
LTSWRITAVAFMLNVANAVARDIDARELLAHFRRRKLTLAWRRFAKHIRCKPPEGCGARDPEV